ncbi:MAG TPA: cell division protein ZapE, partial [Steroidobacteraceae bacterium]
MTRAESELRRAYHASLQRHGYSADAAQLHAVDRLDDLRSRLQRSGTRPDGLLAALARRLKRRTPDGYVRGLYLWGGVGRGKSFLMDLFHSHLSVPARREHFHRFMKDVHGRLTSHRDTEDPLARIAADLAGEIRVLCLDELFVSDIADAMLLSGLFSGLVAGGVTLVFTSNAPPTELYRNGLQRARFLPAIALLERHCRVVEMASSRDWRLRALAQAAVYYTPPGAEAQRALERLFRDHAQGDVAEGGALHVNGRAIPLRKRADNILWFDFAALCEGPRAVADYISLAKAGPAIIVANVPQFSIYSEDAAKRFV